MEEYSFLCNCRRKTMNNCSEKQDIKITELAPVVLFCYTRLEYLEKTVDALKNNAGAVETQLFIYSDAGKDAESCKKVEIVRQYIRTITGFKSVTIIEQQTNQKLEYNVIQGVTEIVNRFGRVIVLEDDIVTSKYFLSFMNRALEFYRDRKEVMEISGFGYPDLKLYEKLPPTFAWRMEGGWGWATWKDRWDKFHHFSSREEALALLSPKDIFELEFQDKWNCLTLLSNSPIPWDICWYIAIYLNHGVTISPSRTLTFHIGEEGTHFSTSSLKMKMKYIDDTIDDFNMELTLDTSRSIIAERVVARYLQLRGNIKFPMAQWVGLLLWIRKHLSPRTLEFLRKLKKRLTAIR